MNLRQEIHVGILAVVVKTDDNVLKAHIPVAAVESVLVGVVAVKVYGLTVFVRVESTVRTHGSKGVLEGTLSA